MRTFLYWTAVGVLVLVGGWFLVRNEYISIPFVSAKQPSLTREVVFPSDVSENAAKGIREKVLMNQTVLKQNQNDIDAWLDLAIQYKEAKDFKGAQQVWEYMNDAFPQQDTSAFNLGVLFHQDLKKYERSEESYREAIRRNPSAPLNYLGLHELYRYAYKRDTTAAVDILLEGMKVLPNEPNLPIALAAYYRDDTKDYKASVQYIIIARDLLKASGDVQKVNALDGEIKRLRAL